MLRNSSWSAARPGNRCDPATESDRRRSLCPGRCARSSCGPAPESRSAVRSPCQVGHVAPGVAARRVEDDVVSRPQLRRRAGFTNGAPGRTTRPPRRRHRSGCGTSRESGSPTCRAGRRRCCLRIWLCWSGMLGVMNSRWICASRNFSLDTISPTPVRHAIAPSSTPAAGTARHPWRGPTAPRPAVKQHHCVGRRQRRRARIHRPRLRAFVLGGAAAASPCPQASHELRSKRCRIMPRVTKGNRVRKENRAVKLERRIMTSILSPPRSARCACRHQTESCRCYELRRYRAVTRGSGCPAFLSRDREGAVLLSVRYANCRISVLVNGPGALHARDGQ